MKVRIGSLEISVDTLEELDTLVQRYGNAANGVPTQAAQPNEPSLKNPADILLLKRFVEAGDKGITTIQVSNILGRRGKAARPALQEWALRIGLIPNLLIVAFEDARVGTQRGVRINKSLQPVATHIFYRKTISGTGDVTPSRTVAPLATEPSP